MITVDQARSHIADLTPDEVRLLIIARLTGEDLAPVGSGYFDEPSEDLVIQLLRSGDLTSANENVIVDACKEVYGRVLSWMTTAKDFRSPPDMPSMLQRVCNVADATGHAGLEASTQALLSMMCKTPHFPADLRWHVVRGALSYVKQRDNTQIPLWEAVLNMPDICAYGFKALLKIAPHSNRIERALTELFLHQVRDGWPVDTPFLMRRAARERGSANVIRNVLIELDQKTVSARPAHVETWDLIVCELNRRDWSRRWLHELLTISHGAAEYTRFFRNPALDRFRCFDPLSKGISDPNAWISLERSSFSALLNLTHHLRIGSLPLSRSVAFLVKHQYK